MKNYEKETDEVRKKLRRMNLDYKMTIKYEVQEKQHGNVRKENWSVKKRKVDEQKNERGIEHLVARVKNIAMKQTECFLETDKRTCKNPKKTFELELEVGPLSIGKLSGKEGKNIKALEAKGNEKGQLRIVLPVKNSGYTNCTVKGDASVVVHWKYYLEYFYGTKDYFRYPQHASMKRSEAIEPTTNQKLHTDHNCDEDLLN